MGIRYGWGAAWIAGLLVCGSVWARTEPCDDAQMRVFTERDDGPRQVEAGSAVGSVVVLQASVRIDGTVCGDVYVLGGDVHVGPTARIRGDLFVFSGTVTVAAEQQVDGRIVHTGGRLHVGGAEWLADGGAVRGLLRLLPPVALGRVADVGMALLTLLVAVAFPKRVGRVRTYLSRHKAASLGWWLLFAVVGGGAVVLSLVGLVMVVVLFPVLLAGVLLFAAALGLGALLVFAVVVVGEAAVFAWLGAAVWRRGGSTRWAALVGAVVFFALSLVPVLGTAAIGVLTAMGMGAALRTALGTVDAGAA